MDVAFLLSILRERHLISETEERNMLAVENEVRRRIFRSRRDEFAGKLANASHVHASDVVLSFELFQEPGRELDESKLFQYIAEKKNIPFVHLDPLKVNVEVLTKYISRPFARKHLVVPISEEEGHLTVALTDPFDIELLFQLKRNTKFEIKPVVAPKSEITRILTEYYGFRSSVKKAEQEIEPILNLGNLEQLVKLKTERELEASDSHVIKAVEYLLHYAYDQRASDIHIEPKRDVSLIRFRIDGVLHDIQSMSTKVHAAVISRMKLLARMDIAERRKPQDGRIKTKLKDSEVELRCSILPIAFGEKLVVRIFDPEVVFQDLNYLGMADKELRVYSDMIQESNGLILVTGPTGSGKTTTLYASLKKVATREVNVTTIEDPVEMVYDGFNQVTVNPLLDLSFSGALRTVLRQDPDIIMVGEIRDSETTSYALQSALTGHMVFSTLHTNDSVGAIGRLFDLGAEPFLLASVLKGSLAQRLVRKVCPHCRSEDMLMHAQLAALNIRTKSGKPLIAAKGDGCHYCRQTGLLGRTGIYELMAVDDVVRKSIVGQDDAVSLRKVMRQKGMETLKECGIRKLMKGETTFEEVLRVCHGLG